jgi:hypothetical protein
VGARGASWNERETEERESVCVRERMRGREGKRDCIRKLREREEGRGERGKREREREREEQRGRHPARTRAHTHTHTTHTFISRRFRSLLSTGSLVFKQEASLKVLVAEGVSLRVTPTRRLSGVYFGEFHPPNPRP